MQSYVHHDDESYLVAALHGDERAWFALESRFRKPLQSIARRWSRGLPADLWPEVTQELWGTVSQYSVSQYSSKGRSAGQFLFSLVPNAAQRVRAAYRSPGSISRQARGRSKRKAAVHHVPRCDWCASSSFVLGDIESASVDEQNERRERVTDARLEVEHALAVASPKVARAMRLMLDHDLTFGEAASRIDMSTTTFKRQLAGLALILEHRTSRRSHRKAA